jgi:hypothetical protein
LIGGNTAAEVATVLPALVLEVGAEPDRALAVRGRMLTEFFGQSATLHGGDGGELVEEKLTRIRGGGGGG